MRENRKIKLRSAKPEDSFDLWRWKNDPVTRLSAIATPKRIPWKTHQRWFLESLKDRSRKIYMAVWQGHRIGMIRFDDPEKDWVELSININPVFRKQGFGTGLLKTACRLLGRKCPGCLQKAVIKTGNLASERLFASAGFKKVHTVSKPGYAIWIRR
ncbi:MAG: GNAT family N-acetyltransferase [Candidatus Omnitrophica bacterium]|nr:GNAT family N-acetyltransferase [Candidatus Omnitrophota bacterium]MDD5671012.1 GNAT family N-acetyltransferase [Candidatus Omnitrophota bacterium]